MTYKKVWRSKDSEYRQESADRLRELFPVRSTVTTTVKHVTRSGMGRSIAVLAYGSTRPGGNGTPSITNVSHHVARALDWRYDNDRQAVYVQGCGMDMAFHLTYTLSRALYAASDGGERSGYLLTNRNI